MCDPKKIESPAIVSGSEERSEFQRWGPEFDCGGNPKPAMRSRCNGDKRVQSEAKAEIQLRPKAIDIHQARRRRAMGTGFVCLRNGGPNRSVPPKFGVPGRGLPAIRQPSVRRCGARQVGRTRRRGTWS